MKTIFRIEKVNVLSENLEFTAVKIRIKMFNKTVFSFSYHPKKTEFKTNLKPV